MCSIFRLCFSECWLIRNRLGFLRAPKFREILEVFEADIFPKFRLISAISVVSVVFLEFGAIFRHSANRSSSCKFLSFYIYSCLESILRYLKITSTKKILLKFYALILIITEIKQFTELKHFST